MASDSSCSSPHPLFSLRATRPDCKPLDVEVVPLVADSPSKGIQLPVFNHDGLFFTPAFVLPLDQKYYALNASFERYQFMEKVERNVELARITPPAHPPPFRQQPPGSLYCQVCRQSYENYQEHINSSQHIQTVKNNAANKKIKQLCRALSKRTTRLTRRNATHSSNPRTSQPEQGVATRSKIRRKAMEATLKSQSLSTCIQPVQSLQH